MRNGLDLNLFLGGLHSAYVRGEAFLAARRYGEATAEFQKILNRGRGSHRRASARATRESVCRIGGKAKAKAAFEAFLVLWKETDTYIRALKSARAEYDRP